MTQAPAHTEPPIEAPPITVAGEAADQGADRARRAETTTARRRYAVLVASHLNVDLYPIFIVSLAVSLQANLGLTAGQRALVIALGPIVSGVCQPLFAWLGDKLNTRLFGPLGLAVGALCISSIGFAQTLPQLLALQTVGLIGVGVYHPISAAVAGKLGKSALTGLPFVHAPRSTGLAIFFLAGMLGGTLGPIIASQINDRTGDMRWLSVMIAPGLVTAWILWRATRRVEHKAPIDPGADHAPLPDLAKRRFGVAALFATNSTRFIANVGCYALFSAWAHEHFPDDKIASSKASLLVSATALGMAAATLVAAFQKHGRERKLLSITGFAAAPFVAAIPFLPLPGMMAAAFCASAFYFIGVPSAISLSHRLLPHATGVTGSLLMGVGWVVSSAGPFVGEAIAATGPNGLTYAFFFMAAMLLLSGLVPLALDRRLVRETLDDD